MAENNKDIFKITLNVYNRTLPVNCTREDEEKYRKSAKLITDLVNFYSSKYAGQKSDIDILYMVLIDIAMRYFNGGGHKNASGGEFYGTLEEAIRTFEQGLAEFNPTHFTETAEEAQAV